MRREGPGNLEIDLQFTEALISALTRLLGIVKVASEEPFVKMDRIIFRCYGRACSDC
jgi:hypothetical protein